MASLDDLMGRHSRRYRRLDLVATLAAALGVLASVAAAVAVSAGVAAKPLLVGAIVLFAGGVGGKLATNALGRREFADRAARAGHDRAAARRFWNDYDWDARA